MRNKITLFLLCLILVINSGCARKIKPVEENVVTHQSSTNKFYGHKVTVFVNATPEQLEQYLTDPDKLKQEFGPIKIERISEKRMEKVGDRADYQVKILGNPIPYRMTMIHYRPGEEIWYMTETADEFVVSVLRYQYKKFKDGVRLTVRFELEEPQDPFLRPLTEAINLQQTVVRGVENGTAMIQAYFDKSLTVEGLQKEGLRGEPYVNFYSMNQSSVWIKAPVQKVHEYVTSPETWQRWEEQFKVRNIGPCVTKLESGSCQAEINIMGLEYTMDFFSANYKPGEYVSSYFTNPLIGVGRFQTFLKPGEQGTEFIVAYMYQVSELNPGGTELLLNLAQLPRMIEQIALEVKQNIEK